MAATLKLEVVTPEAKVYSDDVDMVTLPAIEGEMGVYPNHVPLITQLAAGELVIQKNRENTYFAVGGGFVEITGDRVSVLTDMAIRDQDIDEATAEEARKRAEARLNEKVSADEAAVVQATLANSLALLKVRQRSRH